MLNCILYVFCNKYLNFNKLMILCSGRARATRARRGESAPGCTALGRSSCGRWSRTMRRAWGLSSPRRRRSGVPADAPPRSRWNFFFLPFFFTEKYFRNLVKSNRNQIVFRSASRRTSQIEVTTHREILLNRTVIRLYLPFS